MRDPNKPLLAPGLVSGKVQVSNGTNGHDDNDHYRSTALKSSDFNRINSNNIMSSTTTTYEENKYSTSYTNNNNTLNDLYSKPNRNYAAPSNKVAPTPPPKPIPIEREAPKKDLGPATLASSLRDPNKSFKMEPAKDFG